MATGTGTTLAPDRPTLGYGREGGQMMWHGPMMGWMWIWSLLGLVVLVGLVWLVFRLTERDRAGNAPGTARRILDERYARGEIDEEEYRRRRAGLA
ncbi:SHOCT domain-containing protein [Micromonospora sp. NPDC005806]|uniref:SHOCT domain-containing protein n=1 Tax=Micromonospora sp. NPDC005806 TaxID=3364234 RepID=UPI003673F8BE